MSRFLTLFFIPIFGSLVAQTEPKIRLWQIQPGTAVGQVPVTAGASFELAYQTLLHASGSNILTNPGSAGLYLDAATSNYWTLSGSDVYRASGNVGVKQSSPAADLHVTNTNSPTTGGIRLNCLADASGGYWNILAGGSGNYEGYLNIARNSTFFVNIEQTGRMNLFKGAALGENGTSGFAQRSLYPVNNSNSWLTFENPGGTNTVNRIELRGWYKANLGTASFPDAIWVDATGVTIGSSNAAAEKLHVVGNERIEGYLELWQNSTKALKASATSTITTIEAATSRDLILQGNTYARLQTSTDKNFQANSDGSVRLHNGTAGDPGTLPPTGSIWFNSTTGALRTTKGSVAADVSAADGVVSVTYAATIALDASAGSYYRIIATGDCTLNAPTNPRDGQPLTVEFSASGGARTVTLSTAASAFAFGSDITATTQTVSGKIDLLGFRYNTTLGKWLFASYIKGF